MINSEQILSVKGCGCTTPHSLQMRHDPWRHHLSKSMESSDLFAGGNPVSLTTSSSRVTLFLGWPIVFRARHWSLMTFFL